MASRLLLVVALSLFAPLWQAAPAVASPADPEGDPVLGVCVVTPLYATVAAEYYGIRMAPTGDAPGAAGRVATSFAQSPFGVAVSVDGHYVYDVRVRIDGLRDRPNVEYTVWATPPNLIPIRRLRVLGASRELSAQLDFNKFIIFLTAERSGSWDPQRAAAGGSAWQGPILLQGISRSGLMHSSAGHGPFEREVC